MTRSFEPEADMSATGLRAFDQTLQQTNTWLKELMELMAWDDRQRAYLALRLTLHALRDRLSVESAVHLGAQLPMLVRGFYYEGWHPAGKPLKGRAKEAFLAPIREGLSGDPAIDPEQVARAVFRLIDTHLSAGEVDNIKHVLPKAVRELWPEPVHPA
jgi:uncharacterized protein (DUF2267 family)